MSGTIRFRIFAHSWISDWNNRSAHFLRGLARELSRMGHDVRCYEELGSWSLDNLVRREGELAVQAIEQFRREFPKLDVRFYQQGASLLDTLREELHDTDVVIIHEWNHPEVANTILSLKSELGFLCLLHDTNCRAVTDANQMLRFHLQFFDGVLAFAEPIRRIYCDGFGLTPAWTFREAADVHHFHPHDVPRDIDLLWLGACTGTECSCEPIEDLIQSVAELRNCRPVVHGVYYSEQECRFLSETGVEYRGYVPNLMTPEVYSRTALSLHMPRRPYHSETDGIPSVRMFEALACGSPLLCAAWEDEEQLFRSGEDYIVANSGPEMKTKIQRLLRDESARQQIGANGRKTILRSHTCAHRAAELVDICEGLSR
jgi:spore maturation protein CgeB